MYSKGFHPSTALVKGYLLSLVDARTLRLRNKLCLVVWGLSSTVVSSRHNKPASFSGNGYKNPLKTVCGCLHGGEIENGHERTQSSHPTQCSCICTCTGVGACIPGDPQRVQLRNATTTQARVLLYGFRHDLQFTEIHTIFLESHRCLSHVSN